MKENTNIRGEYHGKKHRAKWLNAGEKNPHHQEALQARKVGSLFPVPPKTQGKRLVITLQQAGVLKPKIYKTDHYKKVPSIKTLRTLGVEYHRERGDTLVIEEVSPELWKAIPATWIRPLDIP